MTKKYIPGNRHKAEVPWKSKTIKVDTWKCTSCGNGMVAGPYPTNVCLNEKCDKYLERVNYMEKGNP